MPFGETVRKWAGNTISNSVPPCLLTVMTPLGGSGLKKSGYPVGLAVNSISQSSVGIRRQYLRRAPMTSPMLRRGGLAVHGWAAVFCDHVSQLLWLD